MVTEKRKIRSRSTVCLLDLIFRLFLDRHRDGEGCAMWTRRYGYTVLAVTLFVLKYSSHSVFAQVTVFNDQAQFELTTGAMMVPIPDSQTAFPATQCGVGDIGPTGIGGQVDIRSPRFFDRV